MSLHSRACTAAMLRTRILSRHARALWQRAASSSAPPPPPADAALLRVAVVGSGPAGMYVTSSLLKRLGEGVRVDVIVSFVKSMERRRDGEAGFYTWPALRRPLGAQREKTDPIPSLSLS